MTGIEKMRVTLPSSLSVSTLEVTMNIPSLDGMRTSWCDRVDSASTPVSGPKLSPAAAVSPSWLSKCARIESNLRCGTMATSTGSGVLAVGVARSAKCRLMTLAALPAETAATNFEHQEPSAANTNRRILSYSTGPLSRQDGWIVHGRELLEQIGDVPFP